MLGLPLQLGAFFLGISTSNLCVFNPFLWVLRAAERDQILSRFCFRISKLECYQAFVASLITTFRKLLSLQNVVGSIYQCPKALTTWQRVSATIWYEDSKPMWGRTKTHWFSNCSLRGTCVLRYFYKDVVVRISKKTGLGNKDFCAYTTWVPFSSKLPGYWVLLFGYTWLLNL